MSYILDALRRLEQDKERAKRGTNPMEAVLVPDLEVEEKPERRRFRWVFVGLVMVVTVIAATYWITRHTLVSAPDRDRAGRAPDLASVRSEYDHSSSRPLLETAPSSSRHLSSGRERTGFSPRPEVAPASKPVEAEPVSIRDDERHPSSVFRSEGTQPAGREHPAMLQDAPEGEVIQEWRGSEIKINAIAYSRESKNRFAVVNLKTVHEGDLFEDLVVAEIQEKGIIFEKAGTKYSVLLGRR